MSAERIASLLPGATEIALALGLRDSLVAVSHSCDFPGRVARLPRVTRTRIPKEAPSREIDRIVREALARGESLYEVDAECLDELRARPDPHPGDLPGLRGRPRRGGARDAGAALGAGRPVARAEYAGRDVRGDPPGRSRPRAAPAGPAGSSPRSADGSTPCASAASRTSRRPRVAFLEWIDPPICGGHWNPELVELAGGEDGLGRPGEPSRTVTWEEVVAWQPEVLVAGVLRLPGGADASGVGGAAIATGAGGAAVRTERTGARRGRRVTVQPAGAEPGGEPGAA